MEDPDHGRIPAANGAHAGDSGRPEDNSGQKTRPKRRKRRPRGNKPPAVQGARNASQAKENAAGDAGGRTAPATADGEGGQKARRRRRKGRRKFFVRDGTQAETAAKPAGQQPGASAGQAQPDPSAQPPAERGSRDARRRAPLSAGGQELPVYAALDLGTNNCRLLMATPTRPGQFRVVDAFSRIVRLGEGLSSTGRLSDAAMDRAIEALKICAGKLKARRVRRARLIATEACRAAENGEAFIARVAAETGLELEIVDRETEARLAVSGCGSLVDRDTPGAVLFDIGGGSSEIALIDIPERRSAHLAHHIVSWTSLPVGVVSLAERFGGRHVTGEVFEAMVRDVEAMIEGFEGRDRLAHLAGHERFHLLGTSGTVTTLAGIHLDLERYDRRRVDGIWMHSHEVTGMTERLLTWDFDARVANPCIGADRADLVLAGCAILEAIRRAWPSPRLRVADRGLREGILTELMARDNVWRRQRPRPKNRREGQGRDKTDNNP
ncbi:MAG: Ppx/GppA family phosphatase [Notoacmeibacter sp.]|nr:Ppx/GppA family phosphatase [Notoacmeibacter sp.]